MFSVQAHNQVLYHLTQFVSAVSSKSTPQPTKVDKQNDSVKRAQGDIDKNLAQTNSYTQISLENLNIKDLERTVCTKNNNVHITLERLSSRVYRKQLHNENKWNVSKMQLSGNKHSFPCAPLTEPIVAPVIRLLVKQQHRTLYTLHLKNPFVSHTQTRSFKTDRSIRGEKKNQAVGSWLTKWFEEFNLGNKNMKTVEMDVDKVKSMLTDMSESPEDKKKIRSAFLDGFETGLGRRKRSRFGGSYLTIAVLMIAVLVAYHIGSLETLSFTHNREYRAEIVQVTFDDCKGVDVAKNELNEIVSYLKNPEKYITLGGKLPKGILLVGPPGTGKTLLARAVAGEAGVPFFYASGAEFDDIFVGQGARRVKSLFKSAKEKAPSVIFIDEIDSVGRKRTTSIVQPYANQTINQLLAEMDGFVRNEGIIVLGATNKLEMLDSALLRPGRFDVKVFIDKPDYSGRKEIINYYLSKVLCRDIDVDLIARKTSGFTGSEIENLINQAALRAASIKADYVMMEHLEYARDKVTMGPERQLDLDEERNRNTAYHEAGHALVAFYTKGAHPIHKITIIPQGASLGHVSYIPEKDYFTETKARLKTLIDVALGGRVAEELTFGPSNITTGASTDLQKANYIAEMMVKKYGMSEKVGLRVHDDEKSAVGNSTTDLMDSEIKRLLNESSDRVKTLLTTHAKELKLVAEMLLTYETLTGEQLAALLTDKPLKGEELKALSDKKKKIIPPFVDSAKNVL